MKHPSIYNHIFWYFGTKLYNKRLNAYKKCIIFIYIKDFSADNFGGETEIFYFCKEKPNK